VKIQIALNRATAAAKTNFLPGLLLQGAMLVFLLLYLWHEETRRFLGAVSDFKQEAGYGFAFVSYVIAAALLPELLRVVFFQKGIPSSRNVWNFLTAAPFWGCMGITVDALYRMQAVWFGSGHGFFTLLPKVLVDQFIYSPFFSAPLVVGYFFWRDAGWRMQTFREMRTADFVWNRIFPVIVAGWCIWIPGVSLVYFMPSALQVPTAVLIQIFWILILTTVSEHQPDATCEPVALT